MGGGGSNATWPRPVALEATLPLPTPTNLWAPKAADALPLRVAVDPLPPAAGLLGGMWDLGVGKPEAGHG